MMRHLSGLVLVVFALGLKAQVPTDSNARPPENEAEAQQLREQVRQRWREHVRTALELSPEQADRLDTTERRFEEQRVPLRARQREINRDLSAELAANQPNQDRVKSLMNERQQNQLKLQQVNREEDHEMQGYLTPVQRARYQNERRRFQEQVAEVVRHSKQQKQQRPPRLPRPRVERVPKRVRP